MYNKTHCQIEKWSKIVYIVISVVTPACFILPIFVYCLFVYLTTDLEKNALQMPLPVWFPFDTKNLIGYLIAVPIEFILATHGFFIMANVSSHGMGAYFFAVAATKNTKMNLMKFNECTRMKRRKCLKTIKNPTKTRKANYVRTQFENRMKLLTFLSNFIQLHSNTVELSYKF